MSALAAMKAAAPRRLSRSTAKAPMRPKMRYFSSMAASKGA
jgi:hypothetical protein